jgi:hypothetical protein
MNQIAQGGERGRALRGALALISLCASLCLGCDVKSVYLGSNVKGHAGSGAAGSGGGGAKDAGSKRDGGACPAGFGDCDGDPGNGCEADLAHDRNHCGSCGLGCSSPDCICAGGQLTTQCGTERADCNGDASDGCEIDVSTDTKNCGACGKVCTLGFDAFGATCNEGHCKLVCETLHGDCDDNPATGCETLLIDNANCGACGMVCTCSGGRCM